MYLYLLLSYILAHVTLTGALSIFEEIFRVVEISPQSDWTKNEKYKTPLAYAVSFSYIMG